MLRIKTCNSKYENGICVAGYHEIHSISFMTNTNHIIDTVDFIARSNVKYEEDGTILEEILVSSISKETTEQLKEVVEHFKKNPTVCKVTLEF